MWTAVGLGEVLRAQEASKRPAPASRSASQDAKKKAALEEKRNLAAVYLRHLCFWAWCGVSGEVEDEGCFVLGTWLQAERLLPILDTNQRF